MMLGLGAGNFFQRLLYISFYRDCVPLPTHPRTSNVDVPRKVPKAAREVRCRV